MDYCHRHGVKVYLTLNTLLTDRELPEAAEALRKASAWGVDAVLVILASATVGLLSARMAKRRAV